MTWKNEIKNHRVGDKIKTTSDLVDWLLVGNHIFVFHWLVSSDDALKWSISYADSMIKSEMINYAIRKE